jgi:SAM-dependent methyltransferase
MIDHSAPIAQEFLRRHNMELSDADHHYLVLRHLHAWLIAKALPAASGVLLDYGSGGQPYRTLFETKVKSYLAADVQPTAGRVVDFMLHPGQAVPMPDCSLDTVLSSQTLEHVADPAFYLHECARLLRSGGVLILTAPMQWRHHEEPYDYYRFTRYGLEHLIKSAGFVLQDITPTGGAFSLIGQILLNIITERGVVRPGLFRFINRATLWLEKRYPDTGDTINWMCLARKP